MADEGLCSCCSLISCAGVFFFQDSRRSHKCFYNLFCVVFRYQRGSRSLAANLSTSQASTSVVSPKEETEEQEEDYDIPEELERVIGELPVPLHLIKIF